MATHFVTNRVASIVDGTGLYRVTYCAAASKNAAEHAATMNRAKGFLSFVFGVNEADYHAVLNGERNHYVERREDGELYNVGKISL